MVARFDCSLLFVLHMPSDMHHPKGEKNASRATTDCCSLCDKVNFLLLPDACPKESCNDRAGACTSTDASKGGGGVVGQLAACIMHCCMQHYFLPAEHQDS